MNLKELMTNLDQVMDTMGVDPNYKENPAYEEVLSEIRDMIYQMNVVDYEKVMVRTKENGVSFEYNSESGDRYSVTISCDGNKIVFSRDVEKKPLVVNNGQDVRVGERTQTVSTYDSKLGNVTVVTGSKTIDDYECDRGEHNSHEMMRKANYDSNGVMDVVERLYHSSKLPISYDSAPKTVDSTIENYCDEKELLRRDKLDTAQVVVVKNNNITFSSKVPLSREHGLQNMVLLNGINQYSESVEIPLMSGYEVQEMLNKETNPKVRAGLARYAVDRAGYYYNSEEDPNFVHQVDEANKARTI